MTFWAVKKADLPIVGWILIFGHQISLHLGEPFSVKKTGHVGEHVVPMPHLGVILELPVWKKLADN